MAIDAGIVTENTIVTGSDGGRQITNIIYILYIAGFFLPLTAIVGFVLAHTNKTQASDLYRSHLEFQTKMFIKGLIYQAAIFGLYLLTSLLAIVTFGIGSIAYILPMGVGLWWAIWTLMGIIRGMQSLGRHEVIA